VTCERVVGGTVNAAYLDGPLGAVYAELCLDGRGCPGRTHACRHRDFPCGPGYNGEKLRLLAATTRGYASRRRLIAIAAIYDGASRTEAADLGGVTLQALRAWVARFNTGGPDALRNNYVPASDAAARYRSR
jgi:Homeodomain-like domain